MVFPFFFFFFDFCFLIFDFCFVLFCFVLFCFVSMFVRRERRNKPRFFGASVLFFS